MAKMTSKLFPTPRRATGRVIIHPITGEILDHGLVLWFPGPGSYTGEDVVEFQIHGGTSVIRGVLDALGSIDGFRHAEQGEFTHRAFDNDKLDLTEIEGLADLLNAETEAQRRQALRQAKGSLRNMCDSWRQQLIENLALVEAVIDFGEDENIEEGVLEQVQRQAAIVSPIPGTTRDVIETFLNIGGYPIVIGDTAGLRQSGDAIEMEGIARAKHR
ncbi:16177_t:CDS:2, partial [Acaulospora colombiana]